MAKANIPNEFNEFRTEFLRLLRILVSKPPQGPIPSAECEKMGAMEDAKPEWVERILAEIEAGR